jgi:glycosyltransferase involved in cell wall biosynthesis
MHIAVDYTPAALQGAGIGRYTRELIRALVPLLAPAERLTLLYPRERGPFEPATPWPPAVTWRRLPLPDRWQTILWHRLRLPLAVDWLTGPFDLFHAPNFLLPPVRHGKTVLTIHDLAFLIHPEYAYPALQRFLATAVPRALARADHILADSEATRQDAIRLFGLSRERISVIGAGVEPRFRPLDRQTLGPVAVRYGLDAFPFVLTVGTLEPRKNTDGLIRAFATARRAVGFPHHLVIVGDRGWLYEKIFAEVARQQAESFVHFLGFVPDADLPALYNLADLFVYPSHYEGFGLPVLEAMACGTPVLCTDTSSLPEIAGHAAWLVPTDDDEALTAALIHLLTEPERRRELSRRGPPQAARWTWDQAARRLLAVYRSLLAAPPT